MCLTCFTDNLSHIFLYTQNIRSLYLSSTFNKRINKRKYANNLQLLAFYAQLPSICGCGAPNCKYDCRSVHRFECFTRHNSALAAARHILRCSKRQNVSYFAVTFAYAYAVMYVCVCVFRHGKNTTYH